MSTSTIKKNAKGYNYTYTDLAEIHKELDSCGITYQQKTETVDSNDYILTRLKFKNDETEWSRGCRIVDAVLAGVKNPAQEQGSAITYARRYSLLMALGWATVDDDAQNFVADRPKAKSQFEFEECRKQIYEARTMMDLMGIWNAVQLKLQQYVKNDFSKRKEQLEKN